MLGSLPQPSGDVNGLVDSAAKAVKALLDGGALASKDILAPQAAVLPGTGKRGSTIGIQYYLVDDSKRASGTLEMRSAKGKPIGTIRLSLATRALKPVTVRWTIPKNLTGKSFDVCLTGVDAAGNRSRPACSPFILS